MAPVRKRSAFAAGTDKNVDYGKGSKIRRRRATGVSGISDDLSKRDSDANSHQLIAHWRGIRKKAETSNTAPKKAARRAVDDLKTRIPTIPRTLQSGISPVEIAPEEMWRETLDYIEDPDDLVNCSAACTLFKSILKKKKTQILFGTVLPQIDKYLKMEEILACRLVCKEWEAGVRTYFNTDVNADQQKKDATAGRDLVVGNFWQHLAHRVRHVPLYPVYKFTIPFTPGDDNQHEPNCNSVREEMKGHPRIPFVGGVVSVDSDIIENFEYPDFCSEMKYFLNDFGLHVTTLDLKPNRDYQPNTYKDMCSLVVTIFKTCPNLKCFLVGKYSCQHEEDLDTATSEMVALPDRSCIEFVAFYGMTAYRKILHQLFIKYSNQIDRFDANDMTAESLWNLCWGKLRKIILSFDMSKKITAGLRRLYAPLLRYIHVSFTRNRTDFRSILDAINSFPSLTSLKIRIDSGEESLPGEEEILGVSPDLIRHSSITSLYLQTTDGFTCFDFLVCFPYVKTLTLGTTFKTKERSRKLKKEIHLLMQSEGRSSVPGRRLLRSGRNREEDDLGHLFGRIVHVNQYLVKILVDKGNGVEADASMYNSNIWEMFPFLSTLEIYVPSLSCSKVFTRSGYIDGGFDKLQNVKFQLQSQ